MIYKTDDILPINDIVVKIIFWNKEYPGILTSFITCNTKYRVNNTFVQRSNLMELCNSA